MKVLLTLFSVLYWAMIMLTFVSSSFEPEEFLSESLGSEGFMSLSSSAGTFRFSAPVIVAPATGFSVFSPSYFTWVLFGASSPSKSRLSADSLPSASCSWVFTKATGSALATGASFFTGVFLTLSKSKSSDASPSKISP